MVHPFCHSFAFNGTTETQRLSAAEPQPKKEKDFTADFADFTDLVSAPPRFPSHRPIASLLSPPVSTSRVASLKLRSSATSRPVILR